MSTVRFTLEDEDGSVTFGTEKVQNWQDIQATLVRSKSYRGIVRKLTNSFSFVHDIKQRIFRNSDINGTSADASFIIEVGNDNRENFSYSALGDGFPMKADFVTLARKESSADINFVDSDFANKIKTGEKEKINFTTLVGLDGNQVTDYNTRLKSIWMHDRVLQFNSKLESDTIVEDAFITSSGFRAVTLDVAYKSDDNIKSIDYVGFDKNAPESFFYLKSDKKRVISVDFDINYNVTVDRSSGRAVISLIKRIVDSDYNEKTNVVLQSHTYTTYSETILFSYKIEKDYIDLEEGDSLQLIFEINFSVVGAAYVSFDEVGDGSIFITSVESYPATTSNCILPHEYFTQMIEIMTGRKNAFYSTYFGRTDILDDKGKQIYTEDGEGAYLSLHDGHMIRNLPIDENPFNSKFKDVLEDYIKLKNLVAQIEYRGDIEVFRIEKYGFVFSSQSEVLDFGDTVADIEILTDEDLTYGSVKVGYKDLELENLNGLSTVHGELNYSSPLTIDNELDLMMKFITESYAIEQTRREQYSVNPDGDTKFDKNIFLVEAKKNVGTPDLVAKKAEDYESVTGILSPENAYNLGITPAKILLEWGSVINGCLQEKQGGKLVLTKSASNNELITKKVNEDEISEGANIEILKLESPIMLNTKILIGDLPLKKSQWDIIEGNSNGVFKFTNVGTDYFFFINLATNNIADMKGSFTGVKANI